MLNSALKTDDLIIFVPLGQHICPDLVAPIPLEGTSKIYKILDKPVCLEGDEFPQKLKKTIDLHVTTLRNSWSGHYRLEAT